MNPQMSVVLKHMLCLGKMNHVILMYGVCR